jgi:hypothetical protein
MGPRRGSTPRQTDWLAVYRNVTLIVRQSQACKDVNTEVEEAMALEAVIRQRLVKTQQIENTYYVL